MNVLHIANGYTGSRLYNLLFTELSKYSISQTVFIPIRKRNQKGIFDTKIDSIQTIYSIVVSSFIYRLVFYFKIRKELNIITSYINLKDYQIIHAHTMFSDGAIAYHLNKKFKIPYIIAVRNTDVNIFLKYLIHLRSIGKEIIINSERIIFLSSSYKTKLLSYYKDISEIIENKSLVIPNGIDEYWYTNKPENKTINETINLIYAGEIRHNKNIHGIINAMTKLSINNKFTFTIIGEGLNDEKRYLHFLRKLIKNKPNIKLLKAIPKEELIQYYKNSSIFVMPSFKESFGLVYAEALSQNLPLIYTQNEGFDNWFAPGDVGYPVNPNSKDDIVEKILLILDNYKEIQRNIVSKGKCFSWNAIGYKYYTLYNNIII